MNIETFCYALPTSDFFNTRDANCIFSEMLCGITQHTRRSREHITDNKEKVKLNLPCLVADVVDIVEPYFDREEVGGVTDLSLVPTRNVAVVETSTRQMEYLPMPGVIRAEELL